MFLQALKKCFATPDSYFSLKDGLYPEHIKKDDDLGKENLQKLKEICLTARQHLASSSTKEIEGFTKNLIRRVEQVPVTSSNVVEIKQLLIKVANVNGRTQNSLQEELNKSKKIEKSLLKELFAGVVLICPKWT